MTAASGLRALLSMPDYRRLWIAGGVGNTMRWLEMLIAGIFTYNLSHSAFLVAVVTVARTLPQLFLGAVAGVIGEALNRKTLLLCGLAAMATSSAALALLAAADLLRVWHIALGGMVSGTVWASEMAVRRRMLGEVVAADQVAQAVAFDSLTNSASRMVGPLLGGAAFETIGLAGAYLASALLHTGAALACSRLVHRQENRRVDFARIPADIAEGLMVAHRQPVILGVVLVTIITNAFGFSYQALIAPIAIHNFAVSPVLVGVLAAAEPFGAIASGLAFSAGWLRLDRRRGMIRGSFLFLGAVVAAALAPWYALACAVLLVGGFGTAAFAIMQTTLVLTEAPPGMRSRLLGIITVCIGTGPLGVLAVGMLSEWLGAAPAMLTMAAVGLACLTAVRLRLSVLR